MESFDINRNQIEKEDTLQTTVNVSISDDVDMKDETCNQMEVLLIDLENQNDKI